jgi:hypothetical protein
MTKTIGVPAKYAGLVPVAFGLVFSLLMNGATGDAFVVGLTFGLSAAGLYSGTKAVINN